MRITIRGYAGRKIVFEDTVDIDSFNGLEALALKHASQLADAGHSGNARHRHMIEFEFLDEPDVNERFFRFGTDPDAMVLPIKVNLKQ